MEEWQAVAVFRAPEVPEDGRRHLGELFPGTTVHDARTGRLTATWRLRADDLPAAAETARARVAEAAASGFAEPVDLRVRSAEMAEVEIAHPGPLELWGSGEVAGHLSVSRQYVAQLLEGDPRFPRPVATLRGGHVWTAGSVRHYTDLYRS
ncbi:hypothetical protein GCM10027160_29170 [Streptomyces calidiresistens]|uniref:Uncharacterized protein n=1 Tax=Streptomyces calidiresistens TaxID=1485586 RepID=A0A7W3T2P7_9ACTN|nr:hypothetical protein [Streptomyces calidiresistens]MBB0229496.1 hypothetical protein [Streptomyces calidiresistens]